MKKRTIILSAVLSLVVCIGLVLSRNKKEIDAKKAVVDRSSIPVAVAVTKVRYEKVEGLLQLAATAQPFKQAEISSTSAGKISNLTISLGSKVSSGQVIGSIDTRQKEINLKDAQDALNKAEHDYQLNKELLEGNAGTAQSVKDAQRTVESARSHLQQVKQEIGDGRIKAPISGMITAKAAEAGEYTNPGEAIATITDVFRLKAVVFVSESDVYKLKVNQPGRITADVLPGKSIRGSVSFVSPVGDENHNYRVELTVNNTNALLKAGTYIKVAFDLGDDFIALQIPKVALVEGTKNPYVYVVNGTKSSIRKITVGRELGENVEVLNGLKEGDDVIVSGQINLSNGSIIERAIAEK